MSPAVSRILSTLRTEAVALGKSTEQHLAEKLHESYSLAGQTILVAAAVAFVLGAFVGWKVL